jgi:SAM-dependent methyltransferase
MVRRALALSDPGNVLDAGCGDGKNAAFLIERQWRVDAFDISRLAVDACSRRLVNASSRQFRLWQADCRFAELSSAYYDMVISYGLYHCLDESDLTLAHRRLANALKPKGLFVCATFNDNLPLPLGHQTQGLFLRDEDHLKGLFSDWEKIEFEVGTMEEDHLPLVPLHRHSLTWAIFRKRS